MIDKITIFLSYCWSDTEIADNIDDYFKEHNIIIDRDIRAVESWRSIKEFMNTIRNHDYVILIISDSYLRSFNCMYEVVQLLKETDFKDRIFPLILNHDLFKPSGRVEYIKYWQNEYNKYKSQISSIDEEYKIELIQNLRILNEINLYLSQFLEIVTDMKIPDTELIYKKIEQVIYIREKEISNLNNINICIFHSNDENIYIKILVDFLISINKNIKIFTYSIDSSKLNISNKMIDYNRNYLEGCDLLIPVLSSSLLENYNFVFKLGVYYSMRSKKIEEKNIFPISILPYIKSEFFKLYTEEIIYTNRINDVNVINYLLEILDSKQLIDKSKVSLDKIEHFVCDINKHIFNSIDLLKYSGFFAVNSDVTDKNCIRLFNADKKNIVISKKLENSEDFYALVCLVPEPFPKNTFNIFDYLENNVNMNLYIELENLTYSLKSIDVELKDSIGRIITKSIINVVLGKNEIVIPLSNNICNQDTIKQICILIKNKYVTKNETIIYIINKMLIK